MTRKPTNNRSEFALTHNSSSTASRIAATWRFSVGLRVNPGVLAGSDWFKRNVRRAMPTDKDLAVSGSTQCWAGQRRDNWSARERLLIVVLGHYTRISGDSWLALGMPCSRCDRWPSRRSNASTAWWRNARSAVCWLISARRGTRSHHRSRATGLRLGSKAAPVTPLHNHSGCARRRSNASQRRRDSRSVVPSFMITM